MAREFTNALTTTPLWQSILPIYQRHQDELLFWQNQYGAQVNNLLALSYAKQQGLTLPTRWWQAEPLATLVNLTDRTRRLRTDAKGAPSYESLKSFELSLEGCQLVCLWQWFTPGDCQPAINDYEDYLKTKGGSLAALIDQLLA